MQTVSSKTGLRAALPAVSGVTTVPSGQTAACWELRPSMEKWGVHVYVLEPLCVGLCVQTQRVHLGTVYCVCSGVCARTFCMCKWCECMSGVCVGVSEHGEA